MITVVANLCWLRPGLVGGSERYAVSVLAGIVEAREIELRLAVQPEFADAHPLLASRCELLTMPRIAGGRAARVAAEHAWLPRVTRGADVVHHLGGSAPGVTGGRTAVTIHDVQYLAHPEFFSALKLRFLSHSVPRAVARCGAVCAVSPHTARTLTDEFGLADEIHIVPPVVAFPVPASNIDAVSTSGRPFLLYPAVTWAHKNHVALLDVLARSEAADLDLVLTGAAGPAHEAVLTEVARRGLGDRVHHLGRVGDDQLDALYRAAVAVVFPSLYEAVGLPVLEAMARGCPVVAADRTGLCDTVGGAGLLVDPYDAEAWARSVSACRDPLRRAALVERGEARAASYDAARSVLAQTGVYEALMRAPGTSR